MQDNDLSSAPTRRIWVTSDVVLITRTEEVEERKMFRTTTKTVTNTVPDLGVLSQLWRWSSRLGIRLELCFVDVRGVIGIWDMLERGAANPFTDWHNMDARSEITETLPYRPDVVGVIDVPEFGGMYGGRGLLMEVVR